MPDSRASSRSPLVLLYMSAIWHLGARADWIRRMREDGSMLSLSSLENRGVEIGLTMGEVVEQRLIASVTAAEVCHEHARVGAQSTYTVVPLGLRQRACRVRLFLR